MKEKALLVISFGTSYVQTRERTIGAVERKLAERFPDRNATYTEDLAELFFARKLIPDFETAADYGIMKLIVDLNIEFAAGNGAESFHRRFTSDWAAR